MKAVSARELALLFLRVGNLTFGGGNPTIAALQAELVESRRWISLQDYGLLFVLCRITPGTNLLAFCAGAGWLTSGGLGAFLAVAAVSAPSSLLVVLFIRGYEALQRDALAVAAISGCIASVTGIMAAGAWQLLRPSVQSRQWARMLTLAIGAAAASLSGLASPIAILGAAAVAGAVWKDPRE